MLRRDFLALTGAGLNATAFNPNSMDHHHFFWRFALSRNGDCAIVKADTGSATPMPSQRLQMPSLWHQRPAQNP
jgi:hypothetical protein